MQITKLRCYSDVVRALKETGGKIKLEEYCAGSVIDGRMYKTRFDMSPLWLKIKDKNIVGKVLVQTSQCRGWLYESLVAAYKGKKYNKVSMSLLSKMPCAAFMVYTDCDKFINKSLPVINEFERKAGWVLSKAYKLNIQDQLLLIGSKKWLRNLPLISAYLIIGRAIASNMNPKGRFAEHVPIETLKEQMDASVYKKLFFRDVLHVIMTTSHLTGQNKTNLYNGAKYNGHHTGIGDCTAAIFYLLHMAKDKEISIRNTPDEELNSLFVSKKTEWGTTSIVNLLSLTRQIHWNIVKKAAIHIQEKEPEGGRFYIKGVSKCRHK